MANQQRVYNAMTGDEIRQMIVKEIDKQLTVDTDFRAHRCFNLVSWEWNLTLKCTPQDRGPERRKIEGGAVQVDLETREPVPSDEEPLVFEVSNTRAPVLSPDKTRVSEGLPVPMRSTIPGVGTVDVPQNRDRTEQTKSVTLRKDDPGVPAAAPSGVAARENVGHHIPKELQEVVVADK